MIKTYLVEMAYLGELHEPYGIYRSTTVDDVIESLKNEIDSNGYTEEIDGGLKFISPNNESHWEIYEYE